MGSNQCYEINQQQQHQQQQQQFQIQLGDSTNQFTTLLSNLSNGSNNNSC